MSTDRLGNSTTFLTNNPYYEYYAPSLPGATVLCIIFVALTTTHLVYIFRSRRWFALPIVAGGIFESLGFGARAYTQSHLRSETGYILQVLFILLAPILFAAGIYMFLGRLLLATTFTKHSILPLRRLTRIFVGGDIVCFLIQAYGGTKLISPKSYTAIKMGQHIILVGLALQVCLFGLFLLVAVIFHVRLKRTGDIEEVSPGVRVTLMLSTVYTASAFIMMRNTYRFVEYVMPHNGYFPEHEWPLYGLDAGLMVLVMGSAICWYYAQLQPDAQEIDFEADSEPKAESDSQKQGGVLVTTTMRVE